MSSRLTLVFENSEKFEMIASIAYIEFSGVKKGARMPLTDRKKCYVAVHDKQNR